MKQGAGKVVLFGFAATLLLIVNVIRSGVLVDRSFLPRFFLLAVFLLVAVVCRFRKNNLWQNNYFTFAFILFYLWNLISCFWAISPAEAIMQSQLVFLSLMLFLVISAISRDTPAFENIFIKTHLVALILSFALAFYKMSTLVFYDPYKIISVSANNNLYAGFLLISLPLVFTGYSINSGFWKWISLTVAGLAIFFIIIIQSRAAYLGLLAGMVVSGILLFSKYRNVFTKKNLAVGVVFLVFLGSGISIFYASLDIVRRQYFLSKIPVWQYFKSYETLSVDDLLKMRNAAKAGNKQLAEFDFAESYYENANLRAIFWKKSACLIKANPIAGIGAGNWRFNIASCREPSNPVHTIKNYTYSQPHNEWISIISELGAVGFLLAVFIFFVPVIIVLYRIYTGTPKPHISAVFYNSFIIGFYLFAVFDFPLKRVEHTVLLFPLFAFLFQKVPLKPLFVRVIKGKPALIPALRLGGTVVVALMLLFTILIASVRIRGEYYTVKMFRNEGKDDDKVIRYCLKAESPLYRITPNTLPIAWFEGVARYHKGDAGSAMICFQRALKSTPFEVRVLNDYAAALYSFKKPGEAKAVLLKTIEIDPFFDDARFNLGAIYYFTGQRDSAVSCIRKCRESQKKFDFLKEMEQPAGYPQCR
jgi:tetratricopeptide (TPR) repeat protein